MESLQQLFNQGQNDFFLSHGFWSLKVRLFKITQQHDMLLVMVFFFYVFINILLRLYIWIGTVPVLSLRVCVDMINFLKVL